jgi:predicted ATP-dependent endonuclease of OLD family
LGFLYHPNDPQGSPYFKDGASTYSLSVASSGEQVILEYITRMTYPSPMNHSLVLIDEPEVHLHPGWVRQLYHALPSIGQDNQFILTTHSSEMRELAVQDGVHIDLGDLQR